MKQLTPDKAAMNFAASALKKGFKFEALHEYTDESGKPLYWRIRLKHPDTGEKWIRPFFYNGEKYQLSEPKSKKLKPLYNLYQLTTNITNTVFICEGEQCVDAFSKLGLLATTSGSADSPPQVDWSILTKRRIVIWPDNDEAGAAFCAKVTEFLELLDCDINIINVKSLNLPPKGDLIDWLKMHPEATAETIQQLPMEPYSHTKPSFTFDSGDEKQSQASILVNFVVENTLLFHDENKEVYAQDNQSKETRRLDSRQFRDWLSANLFDATGKSPREQAIREAITTLSGIARYRGKCHKIFVRVAEHAGVYYLDLAEPGKNRVIEIKAGHWQLINNPPVYFLRPENLVALPIPDQNGYIDLLWDLVNIPKEARLLTIAWLAESLRPDTDFPVLELIGEQGSAKSTTQTMLRKLIDPNTCNLRAAPKTIEDIFVSAGVNWLVSYENISYLSPQMQDAFCILATGGGFSKRKLYSDADETVINVKRAVVLNGISVSITAQDLVDRTVSVEVPIITSRMKGSELHETFNHCHKSLLGGLLNVFVNALSILPKMSLPDDQKPRLLEFVYLGMAIAESMGLDGDDFMKQFNHCRQESIARTIDASPVATALIEWFEESGKQTVQMPVKQLYEIISYKKPMNSDCWPKSAKGFADAVRKVAPALRQTGIDCKSLGKIGSNVQWMIKKKE